MAPDNRSLLDVLKFELQFLEAGGYGRSPREPRKPPFVFEDSLTCLNFGCKENDDRQPCDVCMLMQFVPPESRSRIAPCRHIPLNEKGETAQSFYEKRTQAELEEAFAAWLRATIQRLEKEGPQASKVTQDRAGSTDNAPS
jgi:hypothetical protein